MAITLTARPNRNRPTRRRPARRWRRVITALTVAGLLPVLIAGCTATSTRSARPAYTGDFPDPSVILSGGVYYAFATEAIGGHPAIQRVTSTDMKAWRVPAVADALQALPAWSDGTGTWAPSVQAVGNRFLLYYSTHQIGGHECLSVASAASPADQFVDTSKSPLLCLPYGETIDPSPFLAPNGERYLAWKGPAGSKGVATIYTQKLTADGLHLVKGTRGGLLSAKPTGWTRYNIEAPTVMFVGGRWLLFYSGGNYWQSTYSMGYAVCRGPAGPCTDMSAKKPWVGTHNGANGPGGQSFFLDGTGKLRMAYHAWGRTLGYSNGGIRQMWIDEVKIVNGLPVFPA